MCVWLLVFCLIGVFLHIIGGCVESLLFEKVNRIDFSLVHIYLQ